VTSVLEGGGWSAPCPGHFTPGKDPVPTVQEAGKYSTYWNNTKKEKRAAWYPVNTKTLRSQLTLSISFIVTKECSHTILNISQTAADVNVVIYQI
jgi:hypothetical protein